MAERLKAVRELTYPDARSLKMVREAGGLSKLTAEQREKVRLVRVNPGAWCDNMPEESKEAFIKKGAVVIVDAKPAPKGRARGSK